MTILFRYMLREYVKIFGMCFSGLMTIYLVIDFFEKVRRFLRYDARVLDVLTYFGHFLSDRTVGGLDGDFAYHRCVVSQP